MKILAIVLVPILILIKYIFSMKKLDKKVMDFDNMALPRGIRNNNPGNIRISDSNPWKGKISKDKNSDGSFEQFENMKFGVRALTKLGWTYLRINPNHTIQTFIAKYAPSTENNSMAYSDFIAKELGTKVNAYVRDIYNDSSKQYQFILAIIKHENGVSYDNVLVKEGVKLGNE